RAVLTRWSGKQKRKNRRGVRVRARLRWRWPDEIRVSDYSEAGDHRKGPGDQRDPEHTGLPSGAEGDQDRDQGSGAGDLQGEGRVGAHRKLSGERTAARQVYGLPSGLEESIRALEDWRKDAGIRPEFVRKQSALSAQLSVKTTAGWLRADS